MSRSVCIVACGLLAAALMGSSGRAQQPEFETTRVENTENVHIFRFGNLQAMFIVTPEGVIATDPIGYARPEASKRYLDEIRRVTDQPIRYLIYSHHHFDHIAGGQPFKDAGATFVAHRRAHERLSRLSEPHTVIPDEMVDDSRTITLGGTTLELTYLGLNHSDSTLLMRLPEERIVFAVDFVSVGTLPARGMIDSYPLEWEDSLRKLLAIEWDRLIPGHPGPGGRLGTKEDVQNQLDFLQYASSEVRAAARQGQCWTPAEDELELPKYSDWPNYEAALPFVLRRYCGLWGRGT